jgi:flavin reductase (DIM6/NTAB) family NADH-FMN oxidoreductase RutF
MAIEKALFRQVMGSFATGITVVTSSHQGEMAGLTVNAFCSVSLNPPLVLICVDLQSNTLPIIRQSGKFVVNMLTSEQEELSRCFATPSQERYEHFCYAPYHIAATGAPVLDDVLAFVDARIVAEYPGGDHVIFLGQVMALGTGNQVAFAHEDDTMQSTLVQEDELQKEPLAYYLGKYRHLDDYQRSSLPTQSLTGKPISTV